MITVCGVLWQYCGESFSPQDERYPDPEFSAAQAEWVMGRGRYHVLFWEWQTGRKMHWAEMQGVEYFLQVAITQYLQGTVQSDPARVAALAAQLNEVAKWFAIHDEPGEEQDPQRERMCPPGD